VWKVRWSEIVEQARPFMEEARRKPMIATSDPNAQSQSQSTELGTAGEHPALESISVSRAAYDAHLPQELGLSACAMHYEKLGDLSTALIACDEWLAVQPNYYANLLIKARVLFHMKNFVESETYFQRALDASKGLCGMGVDITCTQRKLGPRGGLGKMFSGIFPRFLECTAHLLLIYAVTDQQQKAEDLMSDLAANPDHLFVSIVAIIAEPGMDGMLGAKYLARYMEVILSVTPIVWVGEQKRHAAHLWMLRGHALAGLGNREEGKQCLLYALTQNPYPQVEQQIRKNLALIG
jgi:tetratricopeptide (TPR) repeat protein